MQSYVLSGKHACAMIAVLLLTCSGVQNDLRQGADVSVLDVDQGLSQVFSRNNHAVVFDMGDTLKPALWKKGFVEAGSPAIEAIVISHGDMDHKGGLRFLPDSLRYTGLLITNRYEDTAALKGMSVDWTPRFFCRRIGRGDTINLLDDVTIVCLWPPSNIPQPEYEKNKNRYSLCFRIVYENTSVLFTGDIDSVAMDSLLNCCGFTLHSDIVVVPHHGSKGSFNPLFYGYVRPDCAIISCGLNNPYNHPSDSVVRFLSVQLLARLFDTRFDGTVTGRSNGEYWEY
jgi:competence protein ComEC